MKNKHWLIIILLLTLTVRLILVFGTPNLTHESYFHVRQVEHIAEHGLPLYNDPLSYGGRELHFLPLFHYLAALFTLIIPLPIVAKLLPNILLSTLPLLVFLIGKKISHSKSRGPIISAFIAGFLPILYNTNSFTPLNLSLPLLFLTIYAFMNIKDKKYLLIYVFSFLALTITGGAFLLIVGFVIYLLLSLIENKTIKRDEIELIIFSIFLYAWTQFIFFKQTLLSEGVTFFWQNVPTQAISQYFQSISIGEAILVVSIIPFITGILTVYRSLFQLKKQKAFLLISLVISTTLLSWLSLIRFETSLAFFGLILAVLYSSFHSDVEQYLKQTKVSKILRILTASTLVILFLTMIFPVINTASEQKTPTNEEIASFEWIQNNTPENSVIASSLDEGHLVTHFAKRKNILDDQFMLIDDVDERFSNTNSLYNTAFETQALDIFDKYGSRYIVLTPNTKKVYDIKRLRYKENNCFRIKYRNETKIYEVKCVLSENENN